MEVSPIPTTRAPAWQLWTNPIFRRYCQSRLRPSGLAVGLLITLLIAAFIFFFTRETSMNTPNIKMSDVERGCIVPLLVFQSIILFILGTAQVSGGMTAETDEGVIDYQRLIPLSPLTKVLGYLLGLPVREYVMFATTLPFTAWALWKGQVAFSAWAPLYCVLISSALTYHFTGLVMGTMVKNRRWAFLSSIFIVFCLYTVMPQLARFGLVFFKYLTITPVFMESLSGLVPATAGAIVETGQKLIPEVKFFGLGFPEVVFTLFCQGGLLLTFTMMLCRHWRRSESLLLGKIWATGFFIWVQILLLGNALPLIEPGTLFPSREVSRRMLDWSGWAPNPSEAVGMSGLYGLVSLLLIQGMAKMITPSAEVQLRGWRRARKEGRSSLRLLSDAANASGWVTVMAIAGGGGWFIFTRALVESRWFPGHEVPLSVLGIFTLVLLSSGLIFQLIHETKGQKALGLFAIFVGIVPPMLGTIIAVSDKRLVSVAAWLYGISPIATPFYAAGSQLSLAELPTEFMRSMPLAFYFWQGVSVLFVIWLISELIKSRKEMAMGCNDRPKNLESGKISGSPD
jgi:hypothetical protein